MANLEHKCPKNSDFLRTIVREDGVWKEKVIMSGAFNRGLRDVQTLEDLRCPWCKMKLPESEKDIALVLRGGRTDEIVKVGINVGAGEHRFELDTTMAPQQLYTKAHQMAQALVKAKKVRGYAIFYDRATPLEAVMGAIDGFAPRTVRLKPLIDGTQHNIRRRTTVCSECGYERPPKRRGEICNRCKAS